MAKNSQPKNILFLGYSENETKLIKFLKNKNCKVTQTSERVETLYGYDHIFCFGYRHIINRNLLSSTPIMPLNLHISYLPFNRGAHPNFWSFFDNTPAGVTIHIVDNGLDTGDIIFQKQIVFSDLNDTFMKTYAVLKNEIENLFINNIDMIFDNTWTPKKQSGIGSYHSRKDLPRDFRGWHSKVGEEIARLKRGSFDHEK